MAVPNIDAETVRGFGDEWSTFDQSALSDAERRNLFDSYFAIFPFDRLPLNPEGFDLGCGSGRWAAIMAKKVGLLHCIDPSPAALAVARKNVPAAAFHLADAETIPLPDGSQDFGYSLGVLHHVPDTQAALNACVRKLKPGAPFLLYLYYALDNRPLSYRAIWRMTDIARRGISRLPFPAKRAVAAMIATTVYWPLSRLSAFFDDGFPLAFYRSRSFYTMRTDALDRFGTRLEKRFTKAQVEEMMAESGLANMRFNNHPPYWTALGFRREDGSCVDRAECFPGARSAGRDANPSCVAGSGGVQVPDDRPSSP